MKAARVVYPVALHVHTQVSGHAQGSTEDYVRKAQELGLKCLGFTDHVGPNFQGAPCPVYFKELANRYPSRVNGLVIFKGAEVNITHFNELDLELEYIKLLDYIIASVHVGIAKIQDLGLEGNTLRVITCLEAFGKYIDILGHPYLNYLKINLDQVIPFAIKEGVIIELNLSLLKVGKMSFEKAEELVRITRENKGLLAVNTDAHNVHELGVFSETEIGEWLISQNLTEARDVINSWHWYEVETYFKNRKSKK